MKKVFKEGRRRVIEDSFLPSQKVINRKKADNCLIINVIYVY
jgi:hypothetical protein